MEEVAVKFPGQRVISSGHQVDKFNKAPTLDEPSITSFDIGQLF